MPNQIGIDPVFFNLDANGGGGGLKVKAKSYKDIMNEQALIDAFTKQKAAASVNANTRILEQKNERIKELTQTLEQYSGCLTQNDIMKIVNRIAELNDLPKFFPKPRYQHPMNKALFVNELSNYLFAAMSRPDVDTLAE